MLYPYNKYEEVFCAVYSLINIQFINYLLQKITITQVHKNCCACWVCDICCRMCCLPLNMTLQSKMGYKLHKEQKKPKKTTKPSI